MGSDPKNPFSGLFDDAVIVHAELGSWTELPADSEDMPDALRDVVKTHVHGKGGNLADWVVAYRIDPLDSNRWNALIMPADSLGNSRFGGLIDLETQYQEEGLTTNVTFQESL